jgi:choline-sulfatase
MSFFEGSARVPLMLAAPGVAPGRVDAPVSTLDLAPTLAEIAGVDLRDLAPWTDGESLVPLAAGARRESPVAMEYAAEGSVAPMVCLRAGRWQFVRCAADPDQLFDLEADPRELRNLADDPAHAAEAARLGAAVAARWDLMGYDAAVRDSQARRHVVYAALRNGAWYPWDHEPLARAAERYMRNHLDLNDLEARRRWPPAETRP